MGYTVKNYNIEVETNLVNRLTGAGIEINIPGEEQSILDILKDDKDNKPVKKKKSTKKKKEEK